VLAEAVERCFTGLPVELVELGRWVSICCNWKDMVRLPSRHEVGDWKLDRDGDVWEYEEGLQVAVEQWVGYGETDLEAFPMLNFSEFWRGGARREERLLTRDGDENVDTEEGSIDDSEGIDERTAGVDGHV
jgi:hypothetical protein